MKITPVKHIVNGEKFVDIRPSFALYPEIEWKRRLNHYSGRSLTKNALSDEQDWLNGQNSALARVVSGGIIQGLGVTAHSVERDGNRLTQLYIAAGKGVSRAGEIVSVNRDSTCLLENVFVFDHGLAAGVEDAESDDVVQSLPTLADLIGEGASLPSLGILVLEPAYAEIYSDPEDDTCELDISDYAFEQWQLMDACRLVFYTWPENWVALPAPVSPPNSAQNSRWRNRIAHAIFEKEKSLAAGEFHPWEARGIPLAIVALDENANASFLDRYAVVRQGGRLNINANGLDIKAGGAAGTPLLWQAQFEQFNHQLAQFVSQSGAGQVDATPVEIGESLASLSAEQFRYLPPVGVLPKIFAQPRERTQDFFPANYSVRARVIPQEQLDIAIRESQPLLPFDTHTFDDVELLIPVPQNYYEPSILNIEQEDPLFSETILRFTTQRDQWLGRRFDVRQKASALYEGLRAKPLEYLQDSNSVDDLELNAPQQTALIELGHSWHVIKGISAPPIDWLQPSFDDTSTSSFRAGFGYGAGGFETELDDMRGRYSSIFIRRQFSLTAEELSNQYEFQAFHNTGFILYLNGSEIFRHNLAATVNAQSVNANASNASKSVTTRFTLDTTTAALLTTGLNTLAIQVHSVSLNGADFNFSPRLIQNLTLANQRQLDLGEAFYGVSLSAESEQNASEIIEPIYHVDKIEQLRAELAAAGSPLSNEEVLELGQKGLEEFIVFIQAKIDSANDKIDFGFVRLQTEIYRIRQFVLGNTEGTKLATSPILASIAQGQTAAATKEEITAFVEGLKAGERTDIITDTSTGSSASASSNTRRTTSDVFLSGDVSAAHRNAFLAESQSPSVGRLLAADLGRQDEIIFPGGRFGIGETIVDRDAVFNAAKESNLNKLTSGSAKESSLLFGSSGGTIKDIEEQSAIVGSTSQYRNVTVAERLEEPIATGAKTSGVATKAEVLQDILSVGLNVSDISVPGFRDVDGQNIEISFANIVDNNLIAEILNGQHDHNTLDPQTGEELGDESAYFNSGVRALENSAVILRKIEGRIHAYKRIVSRCKEVLKEIEGDLDAADSRLAEIGEKLAEARHDLSVARALRQEEQQRVAEINTRRDTIIQKRVPYFVFRRPRFTFGHLQTPVRPLYALDYLVSPPLCALSDEKTPEEISAVVALVRDAPLRWFNISESLLKQLNKKSDYNQVYEKGRQQAIRKKSKHPKFRQPSSYSNKVRDDMYKAYASSYDSINENREDLVNFYNRDAEQFYRYDWLGKKEKIKQFSSLGGLIEGYHGRTNVNKLAAQKLDDIRAVLTCIYQHFSAVLPAIKLVWIERLSEFDAGIGLHNLYNLPRWNELERRERNEVQGLVDWLYQQFDSAYGEGTTFVDNLIRISLLLASDSPVKKIIAGALPQQTSISKGKSSKVNVDTTQAYVGMEVFVEHKGQSVAKGVVDNILSGQVQATWVQVNNNHSEVPADTRVYFRNKPSRAPSKKARQADNKRSRRDRFLN